PFSDRQNGARRQNIDMFCLDLFTVSRINDRHSSRAAEYFGKHTLAVRRQMREDHKRHPIARWRDLKNCSSASTPPAEAPMPTMGRLGIIIFRPPRLHGFYPTPRPHAVKRMFGASVPKVTGQTCGSQTCGRSNGARPRNEGPCNEVCL